MSTQLASRRRAPLCFARPEREGVFGPVKSLYPRGALLLNDNQGMNSSEQPRNPLHGVTLEQMVTDLVAYFGWNDLGQQIPIRCFCSDPSIASSLKFLRKTPWARDKVESLYLFMLREQRRQAPH